MIFTLQPSSVLGKLPYPFHVDRDAMVQRQDFWKGSPIKVIGFQRNLDVMSVDLSWPPFLLDPQAAKNMYVIMEHSNGQWFTGEIAIQSITITEEAAS